MAETNSIKLTAFSRGSGCGCKIAPNVLQSMIRSDFSFPPDKNLLVGNETADDAAVYDLGNGSALISTVDFFTPLVDDAFDFGRIAAANAISDIYAMGGRPLLANAILGWPVEKLPPELAGKTLDGARTVCRQAGIQLAGGHSVDAAEPLFGLSVNGIVATSSIKKNSGARKGDLIYITKALGSGILSTALKRGVIASSHEKMLIAQLTKLNSVGETFGQLEYVHAMTDITGFGLIGHLLEMTEGSGLSAEINYAAVPLMEGVKEYSSKMIVPDNLYRNWNSFEKKVNNIGAESFFTLNDPQTNGGLMVAIDPVFQADFEGILHQNGLSAFAQPAGAFVSESDFRIIVL